MAVRSLQLVPWVLVINVHGGVVVLVLVGDARMSRNEGGRGGDGDAGVREMNGGVVGGWSSRRAAVVNHSCQIAAVFIGPLVIKSSAT